MKQFILTLSILTLSYGVSIAQPCCNVVDGNGKNVVTTNGLCVIAPNQVGANGDCNQNSALDTDNDGVVDANDLCPSVSGTIALSGCPDSDGDGIADAKDECPNLAGILSTNGCPDSDNDGIADNKDECPQIAGTSTLLGCPDSDGDGITDSMDACPNVAGIAGAEGCPDADNDGVVDVKDHCPNEAGVASNSGCPELSEEESESIKAAIEGVNFVSGKDVLTRDSKPKLDNVAKVLLAHKGYKLKVSGYTDSSGDETFNLNLSKKRAAAVKEYLIEDGVEASRIEADGYGEANPIADNSTREGRAKNRRVEFEIIF